MATVDPEVAPDTALAREIFFRELGADGLAFDAAEASFAIGAGVIDVGTFTVSAPDTVLHADASINLNTLTLASDWTLRVADRDGRGGAIPAHRADPLLRPA